MDNQPDSRSALDALSAAGIEQPQPVSPQEPPSSDNGGLSSGLGTTFGFLVEWIAIPLAIVLILHFYVFQAYHVVGTSMTPTLANSDYLIVSKLGASWSRLTHPSDTQDAYIPARDQIVIFKYPAKPDIVFVKRVIGLPGDRVVIKDGKVTIYNKQYPQGLNPDTNHAVSDPVTLGTIDEVVPPGNIFVMGDNRTPGGSFDSRDWGYLPSYDIIGTAILRLYPLDRFQIMSILLPRI